MRKVFIDCGGHIGESIVRFKNSKDYERDFVIYSFEPVPHLYKNYCNWDDINFLDRAVWIEDGDIDFFVDRTHEKASGSTILKEKESGKLDKERPLKCKSIDFSKWLKSNFKKEDYIILKMDIEGAEYKVLEKMIEDGSIGLIDKAYIEFHYEKVKVEKSYHDLIIKKLKYLDGFTLLPEMHKYFGIKN